MKISNNALNFLLAQYRAIFKRAYVKGIASAVLLTAGLAAGQAQAAAIYLNGTPNELPTTGQIANITGNSTNPSGAYDPEGNGEFTFVKINSGDALELDGEVIIKSGKAQANSSGNYLLGTNEIGITGDGKLTIAIDSNGTPATDGLLVISNGETVSVNIGTIDVQNGLLKINDSSTNSGDATVGADTITIGSANGSAKVALIASSTNKTVTLGNAVSSDESGSDITVSENGVLNLQGTGASGTRVVGKSLTIGANGVMLTDAGAANKVSTSNLTVAADGFKVITTDTTKETFAGNTAKIAGNVLVGSGAEWVLAATDDTTTKTVIEGTTTFENGANVQVGGTLTVSGGTLTVADGAQLVATEASDGTTKAGTIVVTKNATNVAGTLKISSADLKDFLTAKDASGNTITYNEIKAGSDGKYIVDDSADKNAAQGSILLSGDGILEFSDEAQLDLANTNLFTFSGGGTNGKSGTIVVNDGTVKANNILVSKAIQGVTTSTEFTVEANTLQIGIGSGVATEDKLSAFNVKNFTAHDEVILDANDGSGDFTIDSVLTLDRDYYNKNADGSYNTSSLKGAGTIKGDDLIISGSATTDGIKITGGQWTNERQSLTIQSGTMSVAVSKSGSAASESGSDGIGSNWTYYEGGNPAELTWHGALTFSGSAAGDANLKVTGDSGANAVVDLLDAKIKWGNGTVTLSGAVIAAPADDKGNPVQVSPTDYFERAGLGILKLSSTQANDYLGLIDDDEITTATQIKVESGGLLLVEGGLSGNVDVTKFSETASAGVVQLDGGKMFATGSINLVDGVGADGAADTPAKFNINGVLGADSISFNTKVVEKEVGTATDKSTVSGGTLAVASTFSSTNKTVEFLSGSGLLLDSNGFLAEYAPNTADATGSVLVDHLVFNSEDDDSNVAKLDVQTGTWTIGTQDKLGDVDLLAGGALNVGPGSEEYLRTNVGASLKLDNLYVTNGGSNASGTITVDVGGELTVNTLQMVAGSKLTVGDEDGIGGVITITGDYAHNITSDNKLDTNAPAGFNTIGNVDKIKDFAGINLNGADVTLHSAKFVLGDAAARALVNLDRDAKSGSQATIDDGLKANFTLEGTSELRLDFTAAEGEDPTNGLKGVNGDKKLTANQAKELKEALLGGAANVANTTKFDVGSYINVGDLALDITYNSGDMTADWDDIKDFVKVESDVTNDAAIQLLVKNVAADDKVSGQFGALETTGTDSAMVEGALGLHQARGDEAGTKFFASQIVNGQRVAAGLTIAAQSSVALYGEGTVGTIRGNGTNNDTTVYFNPGEAQPGTTVVTPLDPNGDAIANVGRMVVANNVIVSGDATAGSVEVTESLTADNLTLGNTDGDDSVVMGSVNVKDTLTVAGGTGGTSVLYVTDGVVEANTLALNENAVVMVGWDAQGADDLDTAFKENESYSGQLYATTVDLNKGGIIVDPALGDTTAIVGFNQFQGGNRTETSFDLGQTEGNLFVGQNSAIGAGFETLEDLTAFIEPQQINGSLSGKYKAIAAINGHMTLSNGTGLTMTAQSYQDFVNYITKGSGSHWNTADFNDDYGTIANTVYFGADSALKLSADAVKAAVDTGAATSPAVITIAATDGQLIAQGGEVIISGDLRANTQTKYKLFTDQGGTNGTGVAVVDINGDEVADGQGIRVATENGFLYGMIDNSNGGTISLSVDKAHAYSIMSGASDPVVDTLITYAQGYKVVGMDDQNQEIHEDLYDGYEDGPVDPNTNQPTQVKDFDYSNKFLAASIEQGNGAAAEAAARLGVYGGAPQAAIKAGQSSTDAIAARFGIGSAISNLTVAGNTQGAALWLAPVYKTSDSDGFDAQGVDYGVNVDLYGVALGADYTLANGISFGAMFNVGSGEVDGEGAASPVTNDFDYYGFGAYAGYTMGGYTMGQFSVVGDISYTVADNEVEASTSVDHIGAQMDSTNLSLGVTGKYELSFNGVNVTPHVGLRYSNIDLDDYTIDGNEVVGSADSDKLNLFSIPVGVTIAKEFKGESWTVAPSFDLTLTGQFGDDELDGSVSWAGVSNLTTDTTTEVFDNFTYGATLGVEAQSVGGVALGINVGYTGSSNVDEFGVNANARFTF